MPRRVRRFFDEWKIEPDGYYLILGRYIPENNYEMMLISSEYKVASDEVNAQYCVQATADYNSEVNKYITKFNAAENALNTALTKSADFESVSAALTSANNFLAKKKIKKQVPTTGAALAGSSIVAKYSSKAIGSANAKLAAAGFDALNISAEEVGALIDSLGSKDINGEKATDFSFNVNKGVATIVGAFEDAEKNFINKLENLDIFSKKALDTRSFSFPVHYKRKEPKYVCNVYCAIGFLLQ